MPRKPLKAIDVKGRDTLFSSYKLVPYPEIQQIIKKGGEAFVEGIDRRTAYSAKKVLSKKLGFPVKATKKILVTGNKDRGLEQLDGTEGYVFSAE
jgi:hypothetical protein